MVERSHLILEAIKAPEGFMYIWPWKEGGSLTPNAEQNHFAKRDIAECEDALKLAHKFDCEEVIKAFSSELVQTAVNMGNSVGLQLPFPVCFFDCGFLPRSFIDKETGKEVLQGTIQKALLCTEGSDSISVKCFYKSSVRNRWCTSPIRAVLPKKLIDAKVPARILSTIPSDRITADAVQACLQDANVVMATLALLETKHIVREFVGAPKSLNKKREAKSRPAISEHEIIKIDYKSAVPADAGGSHASPHLHWRRGHERTLQRGTEFERKVLVKACLVGDPEKGFAKHNYKFLAVPEEDDEPGDGK